MHVYKELNSKSITFHFPKISITHAWEKGKDQANIFMILNTLKCLKGQFISSGVFHTEKDQGLGQNELKSKSKHGISK